MENQIGTYALQRIGTAFPDERACILIEGASSEHDARVRAGNEAGNEGYKTWMDEALTQCTRIS